MTKPKYQQKRLEIDKLQIRRERRPNDEWSPPRISAEIENMAPTIIVFWAGNGRENCGFKGDYKTQTMGWIIVWAYI